MYICKLSIFAVLILFSAVLILSNLTHDISLGENNNFTRQFGLDIDKNDLQNHKIITPMQFYSQADNKAIESQTALYPIEQTAYVAIHTHQFTRYDRASIHGIRTMYKTLQSTNPSNKRDLIVMVNSVTDAETRKLFEDDGLTVIEFQHGTPINTCPKYFNRIHLWPLTKYKRIVYIESDVIVLRPLDELFGCGKFCMVYNTIVHFTDAIFVIEPNTEVYQHLILEYEKLHVNRLKALVMSYCQEEMWHFFLQIFGDIEAANLYEHENNQIQKHDKIMRLSASISLNAMNWYENYSWRLMRSPQFRNYTDDMGIPAYTLSFVTLKPYNYIQAMFFNLAWYWSDTRDKLLHMNYTTFIIQAIIIVLVLAYLVEFGLNKLFALLYNNSNNGSKPRLFIASIRRTSNLLCNIYLTKGINKIGAGNLSVIVGFILTYISGHLLNYCIPMLIPSHIAWPFFIFLHTIILYGIYKIIALCYLYSTSKRLRSNSNQFNLEDNNHDIDENNKIESISLLNANNQPNSPTDTKDKSNTTSNNNNMHTKNDQSDIELTAAGKLGAPSVIIRSTSSNTISSFNPNNKNADNTNPNNTSLNTSNTNANQSKMSAITENSGSLTRTIKFNLFDMRWVLIWEFLEWTMMRQTFYPEFVVKMFFIFPLALGVFTASINVLYYVFIQLFPEEAEPVSGSGRFEE